MNSTIVAVFDEYGQAQSAMQTLFNAGFTHSEIKLSPAEDTAEARQTALRGTAHAEEESGGRWHIGNIFRSLLGADQHSDDAGIYAEAIRRGSYVLSIDASSDDKEQQASDIIQQYHPIDLALRSSHWRLSGWSGYESTAPVLGPTEIEQERESYRQASGETQAATTAVPATPVSPAAASTHASASEETTIPVIEEQLKVGKRVVQKGGVRIFQHITETPVEESVNLREEHVKIKRTPVDLPVSESELAAMKDSSIEVRESTEEAVVEKTAHIVEEISIDKEVTEHTETISDTLKRTDVDIEQLTPQEAASVGDEVFRQHWQSNFGSSGRYEDYAHAYRYGASLAGNQRYRGYRWEQIEPQVKGDWDATHAGSPWERTKQAIQYGWEKMRR